MVKMRHGEPSLFLCFCSLSLFSIINFNRRSFVCVPQKFIPVSCSVRRNTLAGTFHNLADCIRELISGANYSGGAAGGGAGLLSHSSRVVVKWFLFQVPLSLRSEPTSGAIYSGVPQAEVHASPAASALE